MQAPDGLRTLLKRGLRGRRRRGRRAPGMSASGVKAREVDESRTAFAAFARGDWDRGRVLYEQLLRAGALSDKARRQAAHQLALMAPALEDLVTVTAMHRVPVEPSEAGSAVYNPSVCGHGDRMVMLARDTNYDGRHQPRFLHLGGHEPVWTTNHFATLADDLGVAAVRTVVDRCVPPHVSLFPVTGYEDCRLFVWHGRLHAMATAYDRHSSGIAVMVLLALDDVGDIVEAVEIPSPSTSPSPSTRHEKNWAPFVAGDDLLFVYSWQPLRVRRYDPVRRDSAEISWRSGHPVLESARGGTPGLAVGRGYLFVVHERAAQFTYRHRFVLLDRRLRIASISTGFYLRSPAVEFCAGIARRGDRLLLSFGLEDRESWLAEVDLGSVLNLLRT